MANVTQVTLAADSRQVKRATRDLNRMERQGRQTQRTVKMVGTALLGIVGAGAAVRGMASLVGQFKDAARESENFRIRLDALLGSTREGGRAFEEMAEFAGQVPFEYKEIMSAATQLSGVMSGGVDEINEWMPMIADLAAVSGLSIEKTTEQVVRMYSAGAGAADLFRERGITAMLGFQAGVSYSAEETREKLIQAFEDPASQFRGAAQDLAQTWDGTMSMISDSWFQFRDAMMQDTMLWDFFKTMLREFRGEWDDSLDWTQDEFDAWAESIIGTVNTTIVAFGHLGDFLDTVANGIDSIRTAIITVEQAAINLSTVDAYKDFVLGGGFFSDEAQKQLERRLLENEQRLAELSSQAHGIAIDIMERGSRDLSEAATEATERMTNAAREAFQSRQGSEALQELSAQLVSAGEGMLLFEDSTKKAGKANEETARTVKGETHPAIAGMTEALVDFVDEAQRVVEGTNDMRQGWEDEIKVLEARAQGGEDAAKVQEIFNQAQRDGLAITREEVEAHVATTKAMRERIAEAERASQRWTDLWTGAVDSTSDSIAQMLRDETLGEKRARDEAKRIRDDRLQDLKNQLREGTISEQEAREQREEIHQDFADKLEEINKDIGDRMKTILVDSFADAVQEMISVWLKSGIKELITNGTFSGFNLGNVFGFGSKDSSSSSGGSNIASMAFNKLITEGAKKWFGPSSSSGAGSNMGTLAAAQQGGQTAVTSGMTQAQATQALTSGAAYGGSTAVTSGMTGAQATQVLTSQSAYTGGTAAGSSAAGSGFAGMGAGVLALAPAVVMAGKMLGEAIGVFKAGGVDEMLGQFRGFQGQGPLGTRVGVGGGNAFVGGPNQGFAGAFAEEQGKAAFTSEAMGITAIKDTGANELIKLLQQAQDEFETLKKSAANTFDLGEQGSMRVGQAIKDGVIQPVEFANLGLIEMGKEITHAETGAKSLGEVGVSEFRKITQAVDQGNIRMAALRGEVMLNQQELDFLSQIGVTAAQALEDVGRRGSAAMREIEGAANAAAGAVASVGGTPRDPNVGGGESVAREMRRQERTQSFRVHPGR